MAVKPLTGAVPTGPFLTPQTGDITPAWRAFLTMLWTRTGGGHGAATDGWQQPLAAEATARSQGDIALGNAITNEAVLRTTADGNIAAQLASEITARQAADSLLVPKNQLCSLWGGCDLSFLPTTDPGLGKPWLDGNHIAIGLATTTASRITLEDGSGSWALEDSSGIWLYG